MAILKNYLLLLLFICIQTNYVGRIEKFGENLDLHQELAVLLVYVLPLIRYNEVVKYFTPITLWTIGFMLVFNREIPSVSGALLISCAAFIDQYISQKSNKNEKENDDTENV